MMIDDSPMLWSHWPHTVSPTQPFAYRDTVTLLRKLELLRENLDTIADSLNDLIDNHNALDDDSQKRFTAIEASVDNLASLVADLQDSVSTFEPQSVAYNPTKGEYEDSRNTARDMYRELAVFGARVSQVASLTVDQLAEHSTLETAVIGNKTIFGNNEPRVTPLNGNIDPPSSTPLTTDDLANTIVQNGYLKVKDDNNA